MARYIKANPLVAKFLNLETDRNTVKDGNYILWQSDLLPFGPLTRLPETLALIGAIALMPHEAREEQDGVILRPLPEATDARFIMPQPEQEQEPEAVPGTDGQGDPEASTEPDAPETEPAEEITNENHENE